MARIIGFNGRDRVLRFLHVGKRKQTFAGRYDFGKARVLNNRGPAGGQIACGAATKPSRPRGNVQVLCHAQFAA